jgi:hypothetical protein
VISGERRGLILLPTFEMGADLGEPRKAVTKWQRSRKRQ